jgi:lipocalin
MDRWYVIASVPTFFEKNAYNATETYELQSAGTIGVDTDSLRRRIVHVVEEMTVWRDVSHRTKDDHQHQHAVIIDVNDG